MTARAHDPLPDALRATAIPGAIGVVYSFVVWWLWYRHGVLARHPELIVPGYALGMGLVVVAWSRSTRTPLTSLSRETVVVLITSIVCFAVLWHFGRRSSFFKLFGHPQLGLPIDPLLDFFYFSLCTVLARICIPLAVAYAVLRRTPRDYGYGLGQRVPTVGWLYVVALAVGLGLAVLASARPDFTAKYPLCRNIIVGHNLSLGLFLAYAVAYSLIFVSGEAFWRGFMLFGVGRQMGPSAIFVMIVPYVMAHFGKPPLEALGAIGAGGFLGYLAYRHRAFWWGALVHFAVALTMDLTALWRSGITLDW